MEVRPPTSCSRRRSSAFARACMRLSLSRRAFASAAIARRILAISSDLRRILAISSSATSESVLDLTACMDVGLKMLAGAVVERLSGGRDGRPNGLSSGLVSRAWP